MTQNIVFTIVKALFTGAEHRFLGAFGASQRSRVLQNARSHDRPIGDALAAAASVPALCPKRLERPAMIRTTADLQLPDPLATNTFAFPGSPGAFDTAELPDAGMDLPADQPALPDFAFHEDPQLAALQALDIAASLNGTALVVTGRTSHTCGDIVEIVIDPDGWPLEPALPGPTRGALPPRQVFTVDEFLRGRDRLAVPMVREP
ncbi:MAG: hypothetical protein AB1806_15260 [Acidobacteriota bacterium]